MIFDSIANLKNTALTHGGFHKYLKSFSWTFVGRLITMAISFFATLYIARNLGPTSFGELSYAVSLVGLLGFLAPLGLDGILYRELIRFPEKRNLLLGTTFALRVVAGIIIGITTALIALLISTDDVSKILTLILSATFFFNAFHITNYVFLARSEPKYQALITIFVTLVLNILKILIIYLGEGVIYLALVLLSESILYALLYVYVYTRKSGDHFSNWRFEKTLALELLKDSLPIVLVTGSVVIYARVDQVFIKHILGAEQVGIYDAAVRLVDVWNFIPAILGTALFPAIVNAEKVSHELLVSRTRKIAILFLGIPIIIASVISYYATEIISILYGEAFMQATSVLRIYIWTFIGTSLAIHVQAYITLKNERFLLILSSIIPMGINVWLNYLWIPEFGIIGAAYASLVSYSLVPLFIIFRKKTPKHVIA